MKTIKCKVTGMSCASCSSKVEKAVGKVQNVESCTVNLLTGDLTVVGEANETEIFRAVRSAGYGIAGEGKNKEKTGVKSHTLFVRLAVSVLLLLLLMYLSMGRALHLPYPEMLPETVNRVLEWILATVVMVLHNSYYKNGIKAIFRLAPNMDTLVSVGSLVSYLWSVYLVLTRADADLYFETSAMIPTLITVGKALEGRAKEKTTDALKSLHALQAVTAYLYVEDGEREVPVEELKKGDIVAVRPGGRIPCDGKVIFGSSTVDESALTGEFMPKDFAVGDTVSAGTVNLTGYLRVRVEKVGKETLLSAVIQTVEDASAGKAPIARIADKIAGVFVPVVMAIAFVTFLLHLLFGATVGEAVSFGVSVLVISCPCSLGLATPVAIMVGSGLGAKNGILFRSAEALEKSGRVNCVVFDKTGTLTKGKPIVTEISPNGIGKEELLSYAVSLEQYSSHPLARAVTEYGKANNIAVLAVTDFEALPGIGVRGRVQGNDIRIAKRDGIATTVGVFCGENLLGTLSFADEVKEDAKNAILPAQKQGIHTVLLSGDNKTTAEAVAKMLGVEEVYADVLPTKKYEVIKHLQKSYTVCMVGDGINDAPALTQADVGIAMGGGTDIALDSAEVVLLNDKPSDAVKALAIGRAVLRNIYENLGWAFFYNVIGIPVAGGALSAFGITLNPMICAGCMSLSSCSVVANALRLNLIGKQRRKRKMMKKIISIDGMMCSHCEATVRKALEAIPGVTVDEVSHEKKRAVVTLSQEVADVVLQNAVTEKDFAVLSIKNG